MEREQELSGEVIANLALLASAVMVAWYRARGIPEEVVVEWKVPALLAAVWSEN